MYPYSKKLTGRQEEILNFLKGFIEARGYAPSLREICAHFGIKSPKNAAKHLDALKRKGRIRRSTNISRGIEIVGASTLSGGAALSVPIVGRVRAGAPRLAVENIEGHVTLDSSFFRCRDGFLLRADGESMTGAGIGDGDYLLIRPQRDADNGDIVVALLDDEATVKRFSRRGDVVTLTPENPDMEPITVRAGEREISIVGKVVAVIKHLEGER
ncbi:MAG: transcriptional repressor LexA [Thermodesulfobacteriota bacterium]